MIGGIINMIVDSLQVNSLVYYTDASHYGYFQMHLRFITAVLQ